MKIDLAVLGLASIVTAAPSLKAFPRFADTDALSNPDNGMKWVGEIFPGKEYTMYGDAKDIYEKILSINPDYKANNTLVARSTEYKHGGPCGNFATATYFDAVKDQNYLAGVGGNCYVNANSCIRMACLDTSGIYLCNDNNAQIHPSCSYLAGYANDIFNSCVSSEANFPFSGQEFDTDNYNVIVAYANCNQSPSTKPSTYAQPGPNGKPYTTCSNCVTS